MKENNCFLLLGKTWVGMSTLVKIISEDLSVKIGHSILMILKQKNAKVIILVKFDDVNYLLIDTPWYDD